MVGVSKRLADSWVKMVVTCKRLYPLTRELHNLEIWCVDEVLRLTLSSWPRGFQPK